MIFFCIFAVLGVLILLSCGLVFLLKKKHGFWSYFLLGWSFLILLSLPAGVWQSIFEWTHITVEGSKLWVRLLTPLTGWPFNAAGFSMRFTFEAVEMDLWGSKGHLFEYMFLTALQTSIIALIFAIRYGRGKSLWDWVIVCIGVLFLANSLSNVKWYWGVG
jgi:NAD/NADP transhydrogenase beta subunit